MAIPAILQGDSLTRLLQGAAAGAAATLFIGFYWGGWATLPGSDAANSSVAQACANMLSNLK